jgi:hypothetical protein
MPDDVQTTEVAEQDGGFSEAFAPESAGGDAAQATDEGDTDTTAAESDQEGGEPSTEQGETDPAQKDVKAEKATDVSAVDRLKALETERFKDDGTEQGAEKPAPPEGYQRPQSEQQPSRMTKEHVKAWLEWAGDDALPEGPVTIGNDEFDFKSLREDMPEMAAYVKVMGGQIAQRMIMGAIQQGHLVTGQHIEELRAELSDLRFWSDVADAGHSDGRKLARSSEFNEWLGKQSKGIQKLAKACTGPDDAAAILDAYKESLAKRKVKEHDDKQRKAKSGFDALHMHTTRPKPAPKGGGETGDADDFSAGFNMTA